MWGGASYAIARRSAEAPAIPHFVYRGGASATSAQKMIDYEAWTGHACGVLDFLPYDSVQGWSGQEYPSFMYNVWEPIPRRLLLGSVAWPDGVTGTWATAASGAYDSHWSTLGTRLVAHGKADAIIRFAHEFNVGGTGYPWTASAADVAGTPSNFVDAYRRFVDALRSAAGQRFQFTFNPNVGQESQLNNADAAYPGDAYVDHIGLDVYDGWYSTGWIPGTDPEPSQGTRDTVWNTIKTGDRGIDWWRTFASTHNKPLAFPEWGLRLWIESADSKSHGGGDNASFIRNMFDVISTPTVGADGVSRPTAYQAFWERRGFGVMDPDDYPTREVTPVTNGRAAFLARF
jgi:hypothetical protein